MAASTVLSQGVNTDELSEIKVAASDSYNGQAFTYTRVLKERVMNHTVYTLTYPSPVISAFPENNTVPAELYIPDGLKEGDGVPAVVCMHILNGDFALSRMMCSRLSEAGVVALFFKQPFYGSRGGSEGRRRLLKSVDVLINGFDQSTADARRAFDIVQQQRGVDPAKCGVTGISLGAIRAGALCAYEPRIKRAYLSLVAGDLKQVVMSARETRDLRAFIEKLSDEERQRVWESAWRQDPMNAVPQLRALAERGRLRMVRAEKDEIMPPKCSLKLFKAVGYPETQICMKGMGHYSAMAGLAGIMDDLTAFFAADMPDESRVPVRKSEITAVSLLGEFLKDLAALITAQPQDGSAHMAGTQVVFDLNGKKIKFNCNLVLGSQGRFALKGVFPEIGQAGFGRGDFPWIAGSTNVFCGTRGVSATSPGLAELIGQDVILKYQMAVGLANGTALSPDLISNYARTSIRNENSHRVLVLDVVNKKSPGKIEIVFDSGGKQPLEANWSFEDSSGAIKFTHWQINAAAHGTLFEPEAKLRRHDVKRMDVLQMFASVFRFLIDKADD